MSARPLPVAIVGAGFSGTMVAANLAQLGIESLLVEAVDRAGRGVAFSTVEPAHLLNVRAEAMSAWPDRPGDFAAAFEAEGGQARGFAPRRLFGRYLQAILADAEVNGLARRAEAAAVAAHREGDDWSLTLADGSRVAARHLVLATGNEPARPPSWAEEIGPCLVDNPWGEEARRAIAAVASDGGDVLIVGTGLTMVDVLLSLEEAGHGGRTLAVSRRGLIPRAHGDAPPAPIERDELPVGNVLSLWRAVRRRAAAVGWRAAIDALRPHSQHLWQQLGDDQQRRVLRHARPWWDVHRHRIAPEVAARIRQMIADDRLQVVAGRIRGAAMVDGEAEVRIDRRGAPAGSGEPRRFALVFNCTGPLGYLRATRNPLLRDLLEAGEIEADPLGIGIAVDADSRVSGQDSLWAVGPLTKGRYWEIIAVPDIRGQAAAIARSIAASLD